MLRSRRAFSATELIVVMAVTAVLMALAAARFIAWRDGAAVRAASAEALHVFASARELAVVRRAFVAVRFDSAAGTVELRQAATVLVRRNLGGTYRVALSANRDSMVYDPRGLGFGAANLSLVLSRGDAADTLTVSRLGRVK
jgi:prepilin-type N-terminal cleavage/methylation domain-containing protein